jgi:(1->4)-alpha-D-glucan 1-alpha-D-glucosylmutase
VPDIYQGCELWQLALVDPDNRQSVDYAPRRQALDAMRTAATGTEEALGSVAGDLLQHIDDGRIKQFVIWRVLGLRREREGLFCDGGYTPLPTAGAKADHVCTYARILGEDCAIVIAPRLTCTLMGGESRLPLGADVWEDTSVDISALPKRALSNAFTGARVEATAVQNGVLSVAAALDVFPLALLLPDDR